MPEISILMGVYNCEKTLNEAINCIINQTFVNWELIICDDCSSDNTYLKAKEFASIDPRIVLLKNDTNLSLAPTLNKCAAIAKGKYIARMDGDDLCSPDRLQIEYDFLENNLDYALVSCNMTLFDENGEYGIIKYKQKPELQNFLKGSQFCHAGCMMRVNVFKQLDGYSEAKETVRVEDYDLWIRLYQAGYKGYNVQLPLYSMRDDRNAVYRRKIKNRINESRLVLRLCNYCNFGLKYKVVALLPIIKGLIPKSVYKFFHKRKALQHN